MKKALLKILSVVLVLCVLFTGLVACSNNSWAGTTMKNWGAVKSSGGFVAETENYFYVINGMATSTEDNTFGTPVKGALVAVDKTDLSKSEIVVPKLFVASDYKSGLFIDGNYVYYGTPSTDKTADGTVANTELHFMRTKLDGTDTKEFFKIEGISSEYRIVKGANSVYIVYYDTADTALIAFDTATATKTVIAKTDDKADKYSLANHTFVKGAENEVVVFYTTTIYAEEYLENKLEDGNYSRTTESYTNLYAYKVGDAVNAETGLAGMLIGNQTGYTYEVKLAGEYTFYTETTTMATGTAKTYGDLTKNVLANKKGVEIKNDAYIADANVILSLEEVYSFADGKVYKSTFTGNDKTEKQVVLSNSTVASIVDVDGSTLYFLTSDNKVARISLEDADADAVILSKGTVASSWYNIEIVGDYLFYLDNSATGLSYVKCVDLTADVVEKDTNDDGENDSFYLDSEVLVGKMTETDKATAVAAEINAISGTLVNNALLYEEVDGKLTVKSVIDARASYNALSDTAKKDFDETALDTLERFEKAIEMANVYAKLDGMYGYANLSTAEQEQLKANYEEIKGAVEEFKASEDYSNVVGLIENNLKWNYQRAVELFEVED